MIFWFSLTIDKASDNGINSDKNIESLSNNDIKITNTLENNHADKVATFSSYI